MYTPRAFAETDPARLRALVRENPFGLVVAPHEGGAVELTHVPCLLDDRLDDGGSRLRFHVARANPVARALASGSDVTVVFAGPHGYVSASWYERPHEEVPTWNYAAVHVHGRPRTLGRDELAALLHDLAAEFEAPGGWSPALLAPADLAGMLEEIVGFEVRVARLEGKSKLSQNRSPEDRRRVAQRLRARGTEDDLAMVRLMEGDG